MSISLYPAASTTAASSSPLSTSTLFDGVLSTVANTTKTITVPAGAHQFVASDRLCLYTPKGYEIGAVTPNVPVFLNVPTSDTSLTVSKISDGSNFAASTLSVSLTWSTLAYGAGLFVAVPATSSASFTTSPDGLTWTTRTVPTTQGWYGITWNQSFGLFIAYSTSTTSAITSPDGITWTARTLPNVPSAISTANDKFIITIAGSATIYYSTNGTTWTSTIAPFNSGSKVAYGNGLYVMGNAASSAATIAISYDGINWTSLAVAIAASTWYHPMFQNGIWMIAPTAAGSSLSSIDGGATWTSITIGLFSPFGINGCAAGDGIFIGTNNTNGQLAISYNGRTTVTVPTSLPNAPQTVAVGRGIIVAINSVVGTSATYSVPLAPKTPISFGVYAAPVTVI